MHQEEVEERLRSAVVSIVEQNRSGIARWSARAFDRLPANVRDLESAKMLDVGARTRLGAAIDMDALPAEAADWLPWVLPADLGTPSVDVGVRLLDGGVEINEPSLSGAHIVTVPGTNPPFLDVSWTHGGATTTEHVTITQPVQQVIVQTGAPSARLRTASGTTYDLVRRVRPATNRAFGLRGQIVTMDESRSVLPDGIVYIEAQSIVAVQPVDEEAPAGFEDVEVIEVDGTIYPGLVELHRHLNYDALPLWEVYRAGSRTAINGRGIRPIA